MLLFLTPSTGDAGAIEIIIFRLIQAVGAAFFMANSAAIIRDAFHPNEMGKALGINMAALSSAQFVGLVLGRSTSSVQLEIYIPYKYTIWSYWYYLVISN